MGLDPDRTLALAYVPAAARPAVEALWRLDAAFAAILATGTQPMISQMRLAWWREALERLDRAPPPAEPVLQALAAHVLPQVTGAELAAMEEGWLMLLSDDAAGRRRAGSLCGEAGRPALRLHRPAARRPGLSGRPGGRGLGPGRSRPPQPPSRRDQDPVAGAEDEMAETASPAWHAGNACETRSRTVLDKNQKSRGVRRRMLRMIRHRISGN